MGSRDLGALCPKGLQENGGETTLKESEVPLYQGCTKTVSGASVGRSWQEGKEERRLVADTGSREGTGKMQHTMRRQKKGSERVKTLDQVKQWEKERK